MVMRWTKAHGLAIISERLSADEQSNSSQENKRKFCSVKALKELQINSGSYQKLKKLESLPKRVKVHSFDHNAQDSEKEKKQPTRPPQIEEEEVKGPQQVEINLHAAAAEAEVKVVHQPKADLEKVLGFASLSEQSVDFLQKSNILDSLAIGNRAHKEKAVAKKSSSEIEKFDVTEVLGDKPIVQPRRIQI